MVSQNDGWHDAFVMSLVQDKLFFVVIHEGKSAILKKTPGINVGDFFLVKYAYNEQATASNRAQHIITQYRRKDPLGPTRIEKDNRGVSHVLIRTEAPVHDTVSLGDHRRALRLYNKSFGYFIDQRNIVTRKQNMLVDFEFKCRASDHDKYCSILVPAKVFGYRELPIGEEHLYFDQETPILVQEHRYISQERHYQKILGFVCSQIQPNGVQYVWARNLDHDAVLEPIFCPRDQDICSRWVEAYVDPYNNHVVDMVRVIHDLYKTRLERGVPEIRVQVNFYRFHDDGNYNLYEARDFGVICDPENVIKNVVDNGEYHVWIVRQKTQVPRCRWKVSPFQPLPENMREFRHFDRPDSRYSGSLRQSPALESDHRNTRRSEVHNISFPGSQRVRDADELSRAPTTDSEDDEAGLPTIPRESSPRRPVMSDCDDVAPARRRQRAPSTDSSDESIVDNRFERNGAVNGHRSDQSEQNGHTEKHIANEQQLSRPTITGLGTPSRSDRNSLSSNYGTPMTDFPQNEHQSSSYAPPKSYQHLEEMIALKDYKIDRLTALVKFFTSHETVLNAMNAIDPVKCQELMQAHFK